MLRGLCGQWQSDSVAHVRLRTMRAALRMPFEEPFEDEKEALEDVAMDLNELLHLEPSTLEGPWLT